jgi:hypothetical protein
MIYILLYDLESIFFWDVAYDNYDGFSHLISFIFSRNMNLFHYFNDHLMMILTLG